MPTVLSSFCSCRSLRLRQALLPEPVVDPVFLVGARARVYVVLSPVEEKVISVRLLVVRVYRPNAEDPNVIVPVPAGILTERQPDRTAGVAARDAWWIDRPER